jgi:iron(III) transport system ATP-binding protein
MGSAVELNRISKSFGAIKVLDEIDLTVPEGSFTSLLGPSGCGKTTLLNIIGGLERPSGGRISFGEEVMYSEQDAVDVPTERRNIGFVFQSYALWPHMTVVQNVAYPLRIRGIDTRERERRAKDMLGKLELGGLADRYPFQLSGGQQQRVAIARSLVYQPRILLLDEPLSNLDAQLRERARVWLKTVHETFGLTIILVTHDQSEALSLSDHIVLLSKGRIEQQGPALEIYEAPHTAYAAEFVGGANVLLGRLDNAGIALRQAWRSARNLFPSAIRMWARRGPSCPSRSRRRFILAAFSKSSAARRSAISACIPRSHPPAGSSISSCRATRASALPRDGKSIHFIERAKHDRLSNNRHPLRHQLKWHQDHRGLGRRL